MEVFTNINNIQLEKSVICVGTFDGLHQGHKVVIDKTIEQAKRMNAKSLVFTFWPHPHEVIFPEKQVHYLNTFQEKIDLFSKTGIDYLVLFPFNSDFADKTSKEFIKDFLVDKLKMKFFVIGYDHQFGKEREGKYEKMINCAKELSFGIERVEQQAISQEFVSSTKIRKLIKEGDLELANSLLGYIYFTSGTVVKGQQIGTEIGFPTANLVIAPNKIMPKKGVYSAKVSVDGRSYFAMANIGVKPTINDNKDLNLEVNLFDFDGNLYNKDINISFYKKIRNEKKFKDLEALKKQLELDKKTSIAYFKTHP